MTAKKKLRKKKRKRKKCILYQLANDTEEKLHVSFRIVV